MKAPNHISIHRHAGRAALAFEGHNQTIYLSPSQAAWLFLNLRDCVADLNQFEHDADSRFYTKTWLETPATVEGRSE